MPEYYFDHAATLYQGDVREALRALPAESVQTVVTSPPYWSLRDYGIAPSVWGGDEGHAHEWGAPRVVGDAYVGTARWQHDGISRQETPEAWTPKAPSNSEHKGEPSGNFRTGLAYVDQPAFTSAQGQFCPCGAWRGTLGLEPTPALFVAHMAEVFREIRRVLRKDGTCWVNLGDSYATGAGAVGTRPGGGAQGDNWHGVMTSPNRMPLPGLKPKDLVGIPWRVAFALQDDGWYLRQDIIWAKPNPMPESVQDRCTKAHEYVFLLSKSPRYYFDADAIREGSTSRGRQASTGIPSPRMALLEAGGMHGGNTGLGGNYEREARNKRSVWTVATDPFPEAHFATFPPALIAPMILAGAPDTSCAECGAPWERVTEREVSGERHISPKDANPDRRDGTDVPTSRLHSQYFDIRQSTTGFRSTCAHDAPGPGGIVLDPFVGSGTTAIEAKRLGRRAIGIDLNAEYLDMAVRGLTLNRRPGATADTLEGQGGLWDAVL